MNINIYVCMKSEDAGPHSKLIIANPSKPLQRGHSKFKESDGVYRSP